MKQILSKLKPAAGFSKSVHLSFNVLLPLIVFMLVRTDFVPLALVVILLSKWRMFAVRPRFWLANLRANSVDIVVSVALLLFIIESNSQLLQLGWVLVYVGWLVFLKPASGTFMVAAQALASLSGGLMALYIAWGGGPLLGLVAATGMICYVSAHHFFDAFEEPYSRLLSYIWGYFGASLAWVLGHWLNYYGLVAQPVLILVAIGFGLATLYYLEHNDRLSTGIQRQILFIVVAIMVIVIAISSWGNKIV